LSKRSNDRRRGENRGNAASAYNLHCKNTHGKLQREEEAKAKTLHKKKKKKERKTLEKRRQHKKTEEIAQEGRESERERERERERETKASRQSLAAHPLGKGQLWMNMNAHG
jgi:hypothetical protein